MRRDKSMIEVAGVYIFDADVSQRTNDTNEKVANNEGVKYASTIILETEKRMNLWINEEHESEKKRQYYMLVFKNTFAPGKDNNFQAELRRILSQRFNIAPLDDLLISLCDSAIYPGERSYVGRAPERLKFIIAR